MGLIARLAMTDAEYVQYVQRRYPDRWLKVLRGGTRHQALRAKVIAEEDQCHICGEDVDKTISGQHPQGPTIDHLDSVTFYSAAGYFDRNRVRLAHRSCNCRAGQALHRTEQEAFRRAADWMAIRLRSG